MEGVSSLGSKRCEILTGSVASALMAFTPIIGSPIAAFLPPTRVGFVKPTRGLAVGCVAPPGIMIPMLSSVQICGMPKLPRYGCFRAQSQYGRRNWLAAVVQMSFSGPDRFHDVMRPSIIWYRACYGQLVEGYKKAS